MNSYNYFIYPYRYHTSKTNAVLLTSLKKCQQHCIGKCRCYDLYTTPICNEFFQSCLFTTNDSFQILTSNVFRIRLLHPVQCTFSNAVLLTFLERCQQYCIGFTCMISVRVNEIVVEIH